MNWISANWIKVLRFFLVGCGTILVLLMLCVVALNRIFSTETGSEWLVSKAVNSSDFLISWEDLSGNLVDGLQITGFSFTGPGLSLSAEQVAASWDIYGLFQGELVIGDLAIVDVLISLEESTDSGPSGPWPSLDLPLSVSIENSTLQNLTLQYAGGEFHLDHFDLAGQIAGSQIEIDRLFGQEQLNHIELNGSLQTIPPYPLNMNISWQVQRSLESAGEPTEESIQFGGQAFLNGDLSLLEISHELSLPAQLTSLGSLQTGFDAAVMQFYPQNFEIELLNRWALQDYLVPATDYQINTEGELRIDGRISENQIVSSFDIQSANFPQIPEQSISLAASIDQNLIGLTQLSASSSLGVIATQGEFSWLNDPNWNLDIVLESIDLSPILSEWASQIDAQLNFQGTLANEEPLASISIQQLEGDIRGYPLSGSGILGYQNGRFSAENLVLRQGRNQLSLQAAFEQELEVVWTLAAENLAALYPGLNGSLTSTGQITGDIAAPILNASLAAESIAFQDLEISELTAEFVAGGDTNSGSLSAINMNYADQFFSKVEVSATGDLDQQDFNLLAERTNLSLSLSGRGTLMDQRWSSVLSSLNLDLQNFGQWSLKDTSNIEIGRSLIQVEGLCLIENNAEICSALNYSAATGIDLNGSIRGLSVSSFRSYWPANTQFEGVIEGQVTASGLPRSLQGNISLETASLILEVEAAEGLERYEFNSNSLLGALSQNLLTLSANSRLAETGVLTANLELPLGEATRSISGDLKAHFEELGWLDPFLPQLGELNGTTDISLQIEGLLEAPQISGSLNMAEISAFVPQLGINIENGRLNLSSADRNSWQLSAGLDSGEGQIDIQGQLEFNSVSEWAGSIELVGEQLRIYTSELSQLNVSPQVQLQISPERIVANGEIGIPSAQIEIKQLPDTTLYVSKDEIIIGETKGAERSTGTSIPIYADLNLILGDQVYFDGFNIEGRLGGQLRLRETPEQPVRADGSIEIIDGSYTTYGQQLTIDPGLLVFNGAVDNPNLNIRAFRQVEDNLVGVQIGGTVRALSSSLYSTPALSSTETIALLVTGRPIGTASTTDGALLVNAVTALGLSQSTGITQRLQNTFGLDTLTISSDESIEESAITIGKFISPKIFISYAQDILSPNASFSLDYLLSDKFKVKAKSGATQSMDIFYRLEH